jgi:large subunit ribosomal protein L30
VATRKKTGATRTLKVKQIHSGIGAQKQHRQTLRSMGFKRLHQTVELPDNPAVRGMIQAVRHLVQIV